MVALAINLTVLMWSASNVSGGKGRTSQIDHRIAGGTLSASGVVILDRFSVHIETQVRSVMQGRFMGIGRPTREVHDALAEVEPALESGWQSITVVRLGVPVWAELSDRYSKALVPQGMTGAHASFRSGGSVIVVWWDGVGLVVLVSIGAALLVRLLVFAVPIMLPWIPEFVRWINGRFVTRREAVLMWTFWIVLPTMTLQTMVIRGALANTGIGVPVAISWFLAVNVALFGMFWIEHRRNERLVKEAHGRLCMRCRYSLRGLEDTGRCPECDSPYQASRLRENWRLWYKKAVPSEPSVVAEGDGLRT
ncbi:MAG: hypothetical protein R3B46_07220 [Phycisphaerales bacterium]